MEPKKDIKKVDGFSTEDRIRFGRIPTDGITYQDFQPTQQRRYIMEIPLNGEIIAFHVATEIPTMSVIERSHMDTYSGRYHEIGRTTWEPIHVRINDVIGNRNNANVLGELNGWFGDVSSGQDARTYRKNLTLSVLDPTGVVTERFYLMGSFPTMINISTDYGSHEALYEIEMTMSFDHCTHNTYI